MSTRSIAFVSAEEEDLAMTLNIKLPCGVETLSVKVMPRACIYDVKMLLFNIKGFKVKEQLLELKDRELFNKERVAELNIGENDVISMKFGISGGVKGVIKQSKTKTIERKTVDKQKVLKAVKTQNTQHEMTSIRALVQENVVVNVPFATQLDNTVTDFMNIAKSDPKKALKQLTYRATPNDLADCVKVITVIGPTTEKKIRDMTDIIFGDNLKKTIMLKQSLDALIATCSTAVAFAFHKVGENEKFDLGDLKRLCEMGQAYQEGLQNAGASGRSGASVGPGGDAVDGITRQIGEVKL
jgi:hypothetical protein